MLSELPIASTALFTRRTAYAASPRNCIPAASSPFGRTIRPTTTSSPPFARPSPEPTRASFLFSTRSSNKILRARFTSRVADDLSYHRQIELSTCGTALCPLSAKQLCLLQDELNCLVLQIRRVAVFSKNGGNGMNDPHTPRLRRGGHRTRRDRGNGAFGGSDIEGKAAMGSGE